MFINGLCHLVHLKNVIIMALKVKVHVRRYILEIQRRF
jgi:hypothetical protein